MELGDLGGGPFKVTRFWLTDRGDDGDTLREEDVFRKADDCPTERRLGLRVPELVDPALDHLSALERSELSMNGS